MNTDALDELAAAQAAANNGRPPGGYKVSFGGDPKKPKLVLPPVPEHDDTAGLCAWLTSVLRLDPDEPVVGAVHQGLRGPEGHVEVYRRSAPSLRFEPASALNAATRLSAALSWQLIPTDGEPYGFTNEHARRIAFVVRRLCGANAGYDERQETIGIIAAFLDRAVAIEGLTTYDADGPLRYEAAAAFQRDTDPVGRPVGPYRCLIDANTGELAIRVGDLAAIAREHLGSGLPRGWLDGRMEQLGWFRIRLDGHEQGGRQGRGGPHARCAAYRGILVAEDAGSDDEGVTT